MKIKFILGKTIKDFRLSKKLTQVFCAKKLKVTQAQWSAYEVGKSNIKVDDLFEVFKIINVHPLVFMCQFLTNLDKEKKIRKSSFNEYMEVINLAPKLCEKSS